MRVHWYDAILPYCRCAGHRAVIGVAHWMHQRRPALVAVLKANGSVEFRKGDQALLKKQWQAARVRRSTAAGAAHGLREPELGIRSDPGRLGEFGAQYLGPSRWQHPQGARDRAGAQAEAEHELEDVSQGSLGRAGSD